MPRQKQPAPDDLAPAEKTLWNQSEDYRYKAEELREQAKDFRNQGKAAAKPFISQAEALELQASDLTHRGNETHTALQALMNKREAEWVAAQMKIIKERSLGDCPTCGAWGPHGRTRNHRKATPCLVPGTRIVLSAPHPERRPR